MLERIAIIILTLIALGLIALEITLLCMYGSKPVDEIPTWVLWLLFKN